MAYPPDDFKSRRQRRWAQVTGFKPALRPDKRARGGGLSSEERKELPSEDFALPGKGDGPEGKGSGAYPIEDKAHARAALSRASANASPTEKATIKRKVKSKYPDIDVGGE